MTRIKTKTIKHVVTFPVRPGVIYEMLMDSKKHARFTGGRAKISRRVGGWFSTNDGWSSGKTLKLIPNRLIVQSWRGDDWPKGHYSKVMFLLTTTKTGTKLTFGQTGVPDRKFAAINKGWRAHYWKPMTRVLKARAAKRNKKST